MGEDDFLRSILENPRDDARRLVYADWLDERGDSVSVQKSEFLRLTVQRSRPPRRRKWGRHRQRRLQKLAAQLDTDDRTVRFCDACRQNVHFCDTITEARSHASDGHCVAVDLGVIRREGDLEGWHWMLGRVSVEMLRAEEELMRPDPVSAERERRKRERAEAEL
jgi:uncharacterized protein (TIGR02996 family)